MAIMTKKIVGLLEQLDVQARVERFLLHKFSGRQQRVLGLDLNTKSTGFTLLNERAQLVRFGAISTRHVPNGDICQVAAVLTRELAVRVGQEEDQAQTQEPVEWTVGVEDFMRTFHLGRFHTQGLLQLVQLNGMVSFWCWQHFLKEQKPLLHFHPTNARAFFELHHPATELSPSDMQGAPPVSDSATKKKPQKKPTKMVKDVVLQFVRARHSQEDVWTCSSQEACYDIADSYVIALIAWKQHFISSFLAHDDSMRNEFEDLYIQRNKVRMEKLRDTKSAKEFTQWMDVKYLEALNEWMKMHRAILFDESTRGKR